MGQSLRYGVILIFGIAFGILLSSDKPRIPTGKCEKGKIYRITKVSDLYDLDLDLNCIFLAGVEPSKVLQGPFDAKLVQLGDYRSKNSIFSNLFESIWVGKFISKAPCNKHNNQNASEINLGWNYLLGNAFLPFVASLGKISSVLKKTHPSLEEDNKTSLIFDYTLDMSQYCPDIVSELAGDPGSFEIKRSPWHRNLYPMANVVDIKRLVGRQEDGGAIYLGIFFMKDSLSLDQFSEPLAFFSTLSYDFGVNPDFKIKQPLPPIKEDYHYVRVGFGDIARHLSPIRNLYEDPLYTGKMILTNTLVHSRNLFNALFDLIDGLIGSSPDPAKLVQLFNSKPIVNPFAK